VPIYRFPLSAFITSGAMPRPIPLIPASIFETLAGGR
jgi:hypothetical protein